MYINLEMLESKCLSLLDIGLLQVIRQNKSEDCSDYLRRCSLTGGQEYFNRFDAADLVEYTKPKKKSDDQFVCIRLSKKGTAWLEEIEIPEITEDDLKIYSWLEGIYMNSGKEVGNKKKTKMFIAQFRANSSIHKNNLAFLCKTFIEDPDQFEYSKRLEYLFFKPANLFTTKFDIEASRLYQYYLKYKDEFDKKFNELDSK